VILSLTAHGFVAGWVMAAVAAVLGARAVGGRCFGCSQGILSPHYFPPELQTEHMEALLEGCCRICPYLHHEMGIVLLSCHDEYNYSMKAGFIIAVP